MALLSENGGIGDLSAYHILLKRWANLDANSPFVPKVLSSFISYLY